MNRRKAMLASAFVTALFVVLSVGVAAQAGYLGFESATAPGRADVANGIVVNQAAEAPGIAAAVRASRGETDRDDEDDGDDGQHGKRDHDDDHDDEDDVDDDDGERPGAGK